MLRFGIDLGGTKTEILALDDRGQEIYRRRRPTPRDHYDDVIDTIAKMVHDAEAKLGATATVGIGTPGSVSPFSGLMRNSNTTVLNGRRLLQDLEVALKREVRIANDANCFALSESMDGAAAQALVVFGVIIGTGVGGGVVVDRQAFVGANGIAGEWGHSPLPWPNDDERPGPNCYCAKRGCVETFLSGPALSADHNRRTGQSLQPEHIAAAADQGDSAADATLNWYENRLARALATVINVLDPDVIVLGGGLSNIARLYERVPARLAEYVFSDDIRTPLLKAAHGDSSGVRGAAWLW